MYIFIPEYILTGDIFKGQERIIKSDMLNHTISYWNTFTINGPLQVILNTTKPLI